MPRNPDLPCAKTCMDCASPTTSVRCRPCFAKKQRIRTDDDRRVQRWQRDVAAPGLTPTARSRLLAQWIKRKAACAYCPALATSIDHVIPLIRGGTNYEGNLTPCCRRCNSSKAASYLTEWRTGKKAKRNTQAWATKARKSGRVQVATQTQLRVCELCGALHLRQKYCSNECCTEAQTRRIRNAYRQRVGLPVDNRPSVKHQKSTYIRA